MSSQAAREFLEKLAGEPALRDGLVVQAGNQDERMAALVEAGRQNGYGFAAEDVRAALDGTRLRHRRAGRPPARAGGGGRLVCVG